MRNLPLSPPQCHIILLLLLIALTHLCMRVTSAACHVDDESGLLGFKSGITADPSGLLASWKQGKDCCTWAGVKCRVNHRVTNLSLSGQPGKPNSYLSGKISPALTKLKFLEGLYLQKLRQLSGPFPDILFGLPNIKYVYIEDNKLSGRIPKTVRNLTRLSALSLLGNRFTGSIPGSISKLTELTQLNLGGNLLHGSIPPGIQNLKNLTFLGLDRNQLSGPIPNFLGQFSKLQFLRLSVNNFTGEIPDSISTLSRTLTSLELGNNFLTGKIPDFLGKFKKLDTLILANNKLSGTVPKSFSDLTKIFKLHVEHNKLVDPFPQLHVKSFKSLDLSHNEFHLKKIPQWVVTSPIMFNLRLAKCGIQMKFQDFKPSEASFYDSIDLSENDISGDPTALLNKTKNLVRFKASGNKLRFDLGKLRIPSKLKEFDLSRNSVFGKVPAGVARVEKLNVSHNHLCGPIPPTKSPASAFVGNDCLCGAPLKPCKA
ncbi:hypothetical protein TIFTF001_020639 [Ficus carica]|uniref:Leucine-rich repeat-containing N-terminal plant-type domain-containing protein n=1 Tax=Ficus carica TaxID=3494 RepID=A0AA88DCV6_FICCA|nr:hypothetical protein TIFTF001_020639 [Ficus carica]